MLSKGEKTIALMPLKKYEELLYKQDIFRIDKSHLVHLAKIKQHIHTSVGSILITDGEQ